MKLEEIQKYLTAVKLIKKILVFDVIDSTNAYAKAAAVGGEDEGTLVIADYQSDGRGRSGRSWVSEPGENLTFSIILKPHIDRSYLGIFSLSAGLAIAEAIDEITQLKSECKWPNDVLLNGKKICGILCELVSNCYSDITIVMGIGININQQRFSETLKLNATSLSLCTGIKYDRFHVLSKVLSNFEHWYNIVQSDKKNIIIERWHQKTTMIGKLIEVNQSGNIFNGIARGITSNGSLIIETQNDILTFAAGDVTIINQHDSRNRYR